MAAAPPPSSSLQREQSQTYNGETCLHPAASIHPRAFHAPSARMLVSGRARPRCRQGQGGEILGSISWPSCPCPASFSSFLALRGTGPSSLSRRPGCGWQRGSWWPAPAKPAPSAPGVPCAPPGSGSTPGEAAHVSPSAGTAGPSPRHRQHKAPRTPPGKTAGTSYSESEDTQHSSSSGERP